jgi:hypothetical protein
MTEGTLVEWHKGEGDEISYGDELCDIVVEEVTRLRRRLSARIAVGDRSAGKARYRTLDGVAVRFRLVSAEVAILHRIVAPPGALVEEGDLLGVLGWRDEAVEIGDIDRSTPSARVVVNLLGPSGGLTG